MTSCLTLTYVLFIILSCSGVYINTVREPREEMSEFIWDWSSRPNILPPKQWKLQGCVPAKSPVPPVKEEKGKGLSTTKVVVTFLLTNVISLIIGAGIGIWIKRNIIVKTEL